MVWRPPSRSNPLLALRRVVEAPDDVELPESLVRRRADHLATVRVASGPEPHGADAAGEDAGHGGTDAGPRADAEREPSLPVRRRRRGPVPSRPPASQPEPSHRSPERPVRAVITSTPAGAAAQATFPITPQPAPDRPGPVPRQEERERRQLRAAARARRRTPTPSPLHAVPLPEAVPHEPAGPWSTTTEAPLTTPTWLRSSPRTALGGATAAATGTSAVVPAEPGIAATTAMPSRRWHPRLPTVRLPRRLPARPSSAAPSLAPFPLGRPGLERHLATARQAGAAMLVCLAVWALLDAPDLYHTAQTSPIGTRRDVALDVLHPIARASAALGLDRVTHVSDDLLGRHPHAPPPLRLAGPLAPPAGDVARSATRPPRNLAAPLRIPTAADPLRVLAVGDSIGLSFGQGLATSLDATKVVKVTVDAREGTGLARPDAFDWSFQIRADIEQFHPEVIVAMFGGNDDQDLQVARRYIAFGSPQWRQIYAARVQQFAQTVEAGGARLLWAGLPVMRSAAKTARFATVMAVTRSALGADPSSAFVDNTATLSGGSGQYVDALPNGSGQQVIVREPDGVHLSPAGATRLATTAIAAMTTHWHLNLTGSSPTP